MSGFLLDKYPAGAVIRALFHSFNADGASITLTGLAAGDIEIYKDGSATQRASDNGYTVGIDFDAITGIHSVSIDLGDNSDPGFYAVGSQYAVVISSVTIDGQTVNFVLGTFRIENPLDAAAIRAAVGLASANLDTQLADLPTANENADALLDRANGVEVGLTPRQWLRLAAAVLFGKANGLASTTVHYRDTGDSKNRITATVDASGNRSAVTLDAS